MSLGRKIFEVEVTAQVPEKVKNVLELLKTEVYLGIKGGYAKIVFEKEILKQGKKIPRTFKGDPDLDLVITFAGTRKKNIDRLSNRIEELTKKLSEIGISLNPADVEAIEGNLLKEETIRKFLESRDLTINEVLLVPENGRWRLFYTDKCYRDTLRAVGILGTNGKGTTRFDVGRRVASPYGIIRLLRFLIEGKVHKVYLPQWWIEANKLEARRLKKENLGGYGIVLCERYRDRPEFQKKLMEHLNILGLTDIEDFKQYWREQKTFFQLWTGEQFQFDRNRPFREIQQHLIEKEGIRLQSKHERKENRQRCFHKNTDKFECHYCISNCTISSCTECTACTVIPKGSSEPVELHQLLCNYNFKVAEFYWDKEGFYPRLNASNKKAEGVVKTPQFFCQNFKIGI